ncbi:hypothetical protein LguiA_015976 [Lonicera macranthoides]
MEQPPPPSSSSSSTPQPTEQHQPPLPPPSSLPITVPSSSLPSTSTPLPSNPNPNPRPSTSQPLHNSQTTTTTRPPFNRPWQQPHFPHFSSHLSSMSNPQSSSSPSTPPVPSFSSSPSPSPSSSSIMAPPSQRPAGGMAIGVPAQSTTAFSSINTPPPSFAQQFGGLARTSANLTDSGPNSTTSPQVRPIQGMQGLGMTGSLGSPMRPVQVPVHHQQRPVQSSLRPQATGNNQPPSTQNFQGHSLLRVPPVGSPGSPSPTTSQSTQSHNQPWLSSGSQGKPPLPYRPQLNPQQSQQRSHIPQQQHHQSMPTTPQQQQQQQQQQTSSASQSQPPSLSHQPQEHYGQQFQQSRIQSLTPQQQITRGGQGLAQKATAQPMAQPSTVPLNKAGSGDIGESSTRILSKRSIEELVNQIDPMEKLDSEVEDILMDIADEFVESITTFGCSLAKHRKSSTLEAKDILLHLERNWNMTLPGFGGDEIKSYKKPAGSDIHRERLAVIKKSIIASETANAKSSTGQGGGNSKGHTSKPPPTANIIGSPNPKIREAV